MESNSTHEDMSQTPVTKEMWYLSQLAMKETIQELGSDMKESREDIKVISEDVKKLVIQVTTANGRTRKIEDWGNDVKLVLESIKSDAASLEKDYSTNKTRVWTAWGLLFLLGGTIIGLSIMAIDSKIQRGIQQALKDNVETIQYAK